MNTFLFHMATHLRELRELMNWKQDDLAKNIGVSRPSLIAIENDGLHLEKTVALAIFSVVASEIAERRERLESLSFREWSHPDQQSELIMALGSLGLTGRFFGVSAAAFSTSALITGAGAGLIAATGLLGAKLASYLSKPKVKDSSEISPDQLKDISQKSFLLLESKVKACLGVETWDLREFRRKMEDAEAGKNI